MRSLTLALCVLVACSDPDSGSTPPADGATDAADAASPDAASDAPEIPARPEGTTAGYDLDGPWRTEASPEAFLSLPWPHDLRLREDGTPDLSRFPNPDEIPLVDDFVAEVHERRAYPQVPVAWFAFDAPIAPATLDTVSPASPESPLLLIDLDAAPPRLYPVVAKTLTPDPFVPAHTLALAARPGFVLEPNRRHAFVILRSLGDASGALLGVPQDLHTRLWSPDELHAPLVSALDALQIPRDQVAAATLFTTGDVVGEVYATSEAVLDVHGGDASLSAFALDPDDGADHERFCELHGVIEHPQFQVGDPPFLTEGLFAPTPPGEAPPVQRTETVPVTITLPKAPMPEGGYPVVLYFHGSGGLSTQVVDRSPVTAPGVEPAKGLGPAHVLAAHGFAAVGPALPVNPQRVPGADGLTYINPANLKSYRDTMRQGILEQRLLVRALTRWTLEPSALEGCEGPQTRESFRLNTDQLFIMGQSQGAIYANMVTALEPLARGVVPTGSGGLWSMQILMSTEVEIGPLVALLLDTDEDELTHLHPAMQVMQAAWEPVETLNYMPLVGLDPLPGHPVRSVYQPVGLDDTFYPTPVFDALAIAYNHQQAGEEIWPGMQQALALDGRAGILPYPVQANRTSRGGTPYTSVVVQYEGDGLSNPHHIFVQLDAVKHQYGCFFETLRDTGVATVPAPAPVGTACAAR